MGVRLWGVGWVGLWVKLWVRLWDLWDLWDLWVGIESAIGKGMPKVNLKVNHPIAEVYATVKVFVTVLSPRSP
jgi:hypothetical protein